MRASFLSRVCLSCLLVVAGCGAAAPGRAKTATLTTSPTAAVAATPTEALAPNSPWHKLWTLPALPPLPSTAFGVDPPSLPQIAWSPANAQRLYLCRATPDYEGMPAVLHDLYRSDDQGLHWMAYPLPEATANCRLEVDPTNADALILQDNQSHTYLSRDGGQSWQQVPDPPQWDASLGVPVVQIVAGRLYVAGYWTDDLTHWTRWYPVAGEQQPVYLQVNPKQMQTLYTSIEFSEFHCTGAPSVGQVSGSPVVHLAQLCRSEDGGQTWRFLAVLDVANYSTYENDPGPDMCLVLNHPETLYAVGYTTAANATLQPTGFGGPMRSTDGGDTWTSLPDVFVGNDTANVSCSADAYTGQRPVMVEGDYPTKYDPWGNFGVTADGDFYHIVDTAGTRQGVTMTKGVSLLTAAGWQVIAPYPEGVTTPFTNSRLRVLLITPPAGAPVLLAFTDQNLYSYSLSGV